MKPVGLLVAFAGYWLAYFGYASLKGPGVGFIDLIVPGRDVTLYSAAATPASPGPAGSTPAKPLPPGTIGPAGPSGPTGTLPPGTLAPAGPQG